MEYSLLRLLSRKVRMFSDVCDNVIRYIVICILVHTYKGSFGF